jgi:uncharacterized membrane protein YdbT with pleckstrin-like domain
MIALEQNETILLRGRRHWFILALRLLPLIPFVLIPLVVFGILGTIPLQIDSLVEVSGNGSSFAVFILFSWFLFVWIGGFIIWTDYFLDVLVVTDKRIINIEQKGLFSRETASLRLDKIQDITIDINGILATFLSFGNIRIQTAGEQEEFMIRYIKNPESLKSAILKEHNRVVEELREVRIAKD